MPQGSTAIPTCFMPASDAFSTSIARNFLFEFEGKDSDYVKLLSEDLRRLFFHEFNDKVRSGAINRIVISGQEGSGKSFNTLLLSLQLSREGYVVHYCPDISSVSLTPEQLRPIARSHRPRTLFIIDSVQQDPLKAANLVSAISHVGSYANEPVFLFLSRPLGEEAFLNTFGLNTPQLRIVDKFVDFERLVSMFFEAKGKPQDANTLLRNENTARLPGIAWTYRNMAFWNEVLRSFWEEENPKLTEEHIVARAHAFFRRNEPGLLS